MQDTRPRPFLRTTSKPQLFHDSGYGSSSSPHDAGSKYVLGVPQRIIIGFDVSGSDISSKLAIDACESPRSVLDQESDLSTDTVHLHHHHHDLMSSPRSPQYTACKHECYHPPERGIASGMVVASNLKSEVLDMAHEGLVENSVMSNPTTISDQNDVVHPEDFTSRKMHTLVPPSYRVNLFTEVEHDDDTAEDVLFGAMKDSIFCAASPFSNCYSLDLQAGDFLSVCCFCKHHLMPGKDIFMYRGDRAFCSAECRYQQIVLDELKERRPAGATYYPVTSHDGGLQ